MYSLVSERRIWSVIVVCDARRSSCILPWRDTDWRFCAEMVATPTIAIANTDVIFFKFIVCPLILCSVGDYASLGAYKNFKLAGVNSNISSARKKR